MSGIAGYSGRKLFVPLGVDVPFVPFGWNVGELGVVAGVGEPIGLGLYDGVGDSEGAGKDCVAAGVIIAGAATAPPVPHELQPGAGAAAPV